MNKFILITLLFIGKLMSVDAQSSKGFVLNCHLSGLRDGVNVYLRGPEKDTVARAISKNESVVFYGSLPADGKFCFISVEDSTIRKVPLGIIFLENRHISVSGVVGTKNSIVVKGASGHDEYVEFLNLLDSSKKKLEPINAALSNLKDRMGADSVSFKELLARNRELQKMQSKEIVQWISDHPKSLYTPRVIQKALNGVLDVFSARLAYNHLVEAVRNSYYGLMLKKDLELMDMTLLVREGLIIPNFKIHSTEEKEMSIHDIAIKSEYTLIDFWASWCKPCRAEVPELKKVYADFKDKGLNIVGVSSDSSEAAWKKAVQEDGTTWMHGIQDKEKSVTKLFGLNAIPAYILIDRKGKMMAFDCPMSRIQNFGGELRGEALYKKIEELLREGKYK